MGKIEGISHVCLYVTDLDRSIEFYSEVLGFRPYFYHENANWRVELLRLGNFAIEMMQPKKEKNLPAGRWHHVCLAVTDIESVWEALKAKGIVFKTEHILEAPGWGNTGEKYIHFLGPDGEELEIAESMGE